MKTYYFARTATAVGLLGLLLAAPPAQAQVPSHMAADKAAYEAATPPHAATAPRAATFDVGSVLLPRDPSFQLALAANDDGSTDAIPLGFSFDLYGTTYSEVYINNNGNVTFNGPLETFDPFAFPSPIPVVAPFFADVDTRGAGSGLVYYKSEPGRFTVLWEEVGYFSANTDKLNTFELILTDGTDPLVGAGNNVCFSYADMGWTTGDFSGGTDGFGGIPAVAGANAGDDASFFTLGLFDQPGDAYDGPAGSNDGVDYLDGRDVCFSTSDSATNIPPIAQGIADGQVIDVPYNPATGTIRGTVDFSFLSPEFEQVTTITSPQFDGSGNYTGDDFELFATLTTTPGNPATGQIFASIVPAIGVLGGNDVGITLVACDDDPTNPECTEVTITLRFDVFPTRSCEPGDWYVFGFDADGDGEGALASGSGGDGEYVLVYASGPGPLDLSGCDFVAFNPFTERVVFTADLDGVVLGPFADTVVLDGGVDFPEGSFPDGPGAIAFVQGEVEVGATVASVLGRVAYSLIYFDDESLFAAFPGTSPLPSARTAGGAASLGGDLGAQLAAFRAAAGEGGPTLAVGPNPVRGAGAVTFALDGPAEVRLAVYDALGREVAVLADGPFGAGVHRAAFAAGALPAGVYVVRLDRGGVAETARVTVVR